MSINGSTNLRRILLLLASSVVLILAPIIAQEPWSSIWGVVCFGTGIIALKWLLPGGILVIITSLPVLYSSILALAFNVKDSLLLSLIMLLAGSAYLVGGLLSVDEVEKRSRSHQ